MTSVDTREGNDRTSAPSNPPAVDQLLLVEGRAVWLLLGALLDADGERLVEDSDLAVRNFESTNLERPHEHLQDAQRPFVDRP